MKSQISEIAVRAPDQLGLAIRRIRKSKGLTQVELAAKAGIQQRTLSKIENGQTKTEISTLFSICSALGTELVIRSKSAVKRKKPEWMNE